MIWECSKCKRRWYYPVEMCIFCRSELNEITPSKFTVKGITEVHIPSSEHDVVPYFELILEDDFGNFYVRKSFRNFQIGDTISQDLKVPFCVTAKDQMRIGVIGTGLMGKQLAQFLVEAGYHVVLCSRTKERANDALNKIEKGLSKNRDPQAVKSILNKIEASVDLEKLHEVDLIIETIVEDLDKKRQLLSDISSICPENAIIATNTSSLPISELASSFAHPERVIGMHFFNPVAKMQLVEVVYGRTTSKETIESIMNFTEGLGKRPIMVKDTPGFIVNRSLMPFINEAASLLQEDVSPNDIDEAIKLGLNHPMGPLGLADLVGLDICVSIMDTLYQRFKDVRYMPSPIFNELISKGYLGKKTGKGFYDYGH